MVRARLDAMAECSLFTHQQMGTQWNHWGDKGSKERNWPSYLTCRWLRTSVLSNRHSPTYKSIQDYLYTTLVFEYKIVISAMFLLLDSLSSGIHLLPFPLMCTHKISELKMFLPVKSKVSIFKFWKSSESVTAR